jgi:hypothetical protein
VTDIERKHFECVGHVVRMDQTSMAEKILDSKSEGRRKARKPRLRRPEDGREQFISDESEVIGKWK